MKKKPNKRTANCKQGIALISIIVEFDGTKRDTEIKKSLSKEVDDKALRAVNMIPKWKPAKVGGKVVAMVYNIPFIVK
ncbi:energy transducer TonB [uncultured Bacteroides sp.]|uniref:energy transducer TonB n=1 Tax=uncultured Bacteroides sp. TaxID=162156 RepID=UPI003390418F